MFGLSLTSTVDALQRDLLKTLAGQRKEVTKNIGYLKILGHLVDEYNAPSRLILAMIKDLDGDDDA